MGTFAYKTENATYCYAVELENEWDYADFIISLNDKISCEFGKKLKYWTCQPEDTEMYDNNRSYSGRYIEYIDHDIMGHTLRVKPIVRSGYSEGVSLDYEIEVDCFGVTFDSIKDAVEYLQEEEEAWKLTEKSMNKHLDIIVKKLEQIYELYKTRYAPRNAWC